MLRCLNCGLRVQRIQRHVVTTLPQELLIVLSIWLRIEYLPMEDVMCQACYVLIQNADVNTPRTLGHTNVCAGCGCSLNEARLHFLEENQPLYEYFPWITSIQNGRDSYAVCHNCWRRASRQAAQDSQCEMAIPQLPSEPAPASAPASLPDQRSIESAPIYLPHYKRAASTSRHCIYADCGNASMHLIPTFVKKKLITEYNFYVPRFARVCQHHLLSNIWHELPEQSYTISSFTSNQLEDLIDIAKRNTVTFDFEHVEEMSNHICHYWTGLDVTEFVILLNELPLYNQVPSPKTALAIFLIKMRTGDSNKRLCSLFNIPRSTMERHMNIVRSCFMEHFVPLPNGLQHLTRQDIIRRNLSIPNAFFGNPNDSEKDQSTINQQIAQSALNQLNINLIEPMVVDGTEETDIKVKDPLLLNVDDIKLEEPSTQDLPETADGVDAESDNEQYMSDLGDQIEGIRERKEVEVTFEETEQNKLQQDPMAKKINLVRGVNKSTQDKIYVKMGTDRGKAVASKPKCDNINNLVATDNINSNIIIKSEIISNTGEAVGSDEKKECFKFKHSGRVTSDLMKHTTDHDKIVTKRNVRNNEECVKENLELKSHSSETRFSRKLSVKENGRMHTGTKGHVCGICKKGFPKKNDLTKHVFRIHTYEKLYKCDECGKGFNEMSNLKRHSRMHTGEKPHKCGQCGKGFSQKAALTNHIRKHTGEKPYKCDECGKDFNEMGNLNRHSRIHTGEKPHKCGQCGKGFSQKAALTIHIRKHTGEKPYKCGECGRAYFKKTGLIVHSRLHTGEKPYKCGDCGQSFHHKAGLAVHRRIHTGEKPKAYTCDDCGKGYQQKSNLIEHIRIYTGKKPYKCDDCGRGFHQKGNLVEHIRIYTGKELYNCEDCGIGFHQKSDLTQHFRTHAGKKPYNCGVCGQGFDRKNVLTQHSRLHTVEKPYKCGDCGKGFRVNAQLKKHIQIHTGEKPFLCNVCGKSYAQNSSLLYHVRVTHRD